MQHSERRTLVDNCFVQLVREPYKLAQKKYEVLNISRGGLCFVSNDAYELNERVKLSIVIDKQAVHSANGRVCYRSHLQAQNVSSYGLSFLDNFVDTDILCETVEIKDALSNEI